MIRKNRFTFEDLYFKYIVIFLFTFTMLFAKDDQGRVLSQITLNLNLELYAQILFVLMLFIVIIKLFFNSNFDLISVLLIFRIVFAFCSILNYDGSLQDFFAAGFFQLIFLSIEYIFIINLTLNIKYIENFLKFIFEFISIVLVIQVFYVFIDAIIKGISITSIKSYIAIPIGKSNFVAMLIAFLLVFIYLYLERTIYKKILVILLLCTLVITLSDGAIFSMFFLFLVYFLNKAKNKKIKTFLFILIIIFILLAFLIPTQTSKNSVVNILSLKERVNLILNGQFKEASSGRVQLYSEYINSIKKHFIFGNGYYKPFVKIDGLAHNFLIQEAYNAGIISITIFMTILILVLRNLKKYINNDCFIKATYYSMLYIIIHSLIEPGILGYKIGFYFWLTIGFSYLKIKNIKGCCYVNSCNNS